MLYRCIIKDTAHLPSLVPPREVSISPSWLWRRYEIWIFSIFSTTKGLSARESAAMNAPLQPLLSPTKVIADGCGTSAWEGKNSFSNYKFDSKRRRWKQVFLDFLLSEGTHDRGICGNVRISRAPIGGVPRDRRHTNWQYRHGRQGSPVSKFDWLWRRWKSIFLDFLRRRGT